MGKRSRKRSAELDTAAVRAAGTSTRAERRQATAPPAATSPPRRGARRRPPSEDRPPAPWGKFPLIELLVLISLGLLIGGFVSHHVPMLIAGLGIGSLAGLELSVREHFAGFRSHTTLLAGCAAFAALAVTYFVAGSGQRFVMIPVAGVVFMVAYWVFRRVFAKRSGGLGFRS